jgi:hypothetical protein
MRVSQAASILVVLDAMAMTFATPVSSSAQKDLSFAYEVFDIDPEASHNIDDVILVPVSSLCLRQCSQAAARSCTTQYAAP